MAVQHSLCRTGLETPNTGFLAMRLMYGCVYLEEKIVLLNVFISNKTKSSNCTKKHVMRKQIFCQNLYSVVSNQVRHKPGCRATEIARG